MKIKTSELIGPTLDWAVSKCEGTLKHYAQPNEKRGTTVWEVIPQTRRYSSIWAQGGPVIEREKIETYWHTAMDMWAARHGDNLRYGPTPLIAAMRCYCCAKLGDEIDIPEGLCQQQSS